VREKQLLGNTMYRIAPDIDWSFLEGLEVTQVCFDQFNLLLSLYPTGSINIEGEWALHDSKGKEVDRRVEHSARDCWRVHRLLGTKIIKCVRVSDRVLGLHLDDRSVLTITDDSDQYETFSVQFKDRSIYV
jgi:hypothetical protein